MSQVPTESITIEALSAQDEYGATPLHILANKRKLNLVPTNLLTEEVLLITTKNGWNVLHVAALSGNLDQIPKHVLTLENLMTKNNVGCSVLRKAASCSYFHQIPKDILTPECLFDSTKFGSTVLELLVKNNTLDLLLGIRMLDEAKPIVGEAWWELNTRALEELQRATPTTLKDIQNTIDLDL